MTVQVLGIDHIHFYVDDVNFWSDWYQSIWKFQLRGSCRETQSLWLSQGSIHVVLSQGKETVAYRRHHPQGVADVALRIQDSELAYDYLQDLVPHQVVMKWQDPKLQALELFLPDPENLDNCIALKHTLIERQIQDPDPILPGFITYDLGPEASGQAYFSHIDHLVLNTPTLAGIQKWYQSLFGWQSLYQYRITTSKSGLNSVVLGDLTIPLQLALNEPIGSQSQIQEFVDAHGGSGIQHIALHTDDIVSTVKHLRQRGVSFLPALSSPRSVSSALAEEVKQALIAEDILWDETAPNAAIFQIFTQPLFSEPTFFYEIIQRDPDAKGFGEGNFQALFEAIEEQYRA
jgi:4-hydroxyphenylpyruvate dioxygenase